MSSPLIAFDTCVLLDLLDPNHPDVDQNEVAYLQELEREAKRSDVPILIPAMVVAEISKHKNKDGTLRELTEDELDRLHRTLDENSAFDVRAIDGEAARAAQRILRKGVHLQDALILGACVRYKAAVLLTRDGIKRRRKSLLIPHDNTVGDPLIRIMRPSKWQLHLNGGQTTIFNPGSSTGP